MTPTKEAAIVGAASSNGTATTKFHGVRDILCCDT
jgi:hypothetical protein